MKFIWRWKWIADAYEKDGAITAARFLSKFVMDVPWAHFDIAGQDEQSSDKGYNPKGSKGPAVRLIVDLLRHWSKS